MSETYPVHGDQCLEWEGTESQAIDDIIYKSANVFRYNYHAFGINKGGIAVEVSLNGIDWYEVLLKTLYQNTEQHGITQGEIAVLKGKFKFIRVKARFPDSNAHGIHGCK